MKQEFKEGDIVRHKLNGQRMIVLSSEGRGVSYVPKTRVRIQRYVLEEAIFDTNELILEQVTSTFKNQVEEDLESEKVKESTINKY